MDFRVFLITQVCILCNFMTIMISMKQVLKKLIKLDKNLDKHAGFLFLLGLLVALRIPNLTEPYWYGDEGIYLTIGQTLNKGALLYRDIVDHKTPLIYYLARVHTQLNFRILLIVWMLFTTTFFYAVTLRITKQKLASTIAAAVFIILTTLPWFEGNIPNGELFVMGFVLAGVWLGLKSRLGKVLEDKNPDKKLTLKDVKLLVLSGAMFGLGILTKVPALFDLIGFGALALINLAEKFSFQPKKYSQLASALTQRVLDYGLIFIGAILPIILSVAYFVARGAGADYLQFGLLYNFHYAGNWDLGFSSPILQFAFTLQGKFLLTATTILGILALKNRLSKASQFSTIWFFLSLFASLLSNRPYPHYFIQVLPPLILLFATTLSKFIKNKGKKLQASQQVGAAVLTVSILILLTVFKLLNVGFYPVKSYYQNWLKLASGQISTQEYNQTFNWIMRENYQVATYLKQEDAKEIFIWGTNPMLYALSDTKPASKFTVAFHIADLKVFDQTLEEIKSARPKFIVVMKKETIPFDSFFDYLSLYYRPVQDYDQMTIWKLQ